MFEADAGNAGTRWPLIRLRPGCESECTLLSREYFCLTTHFHRVTILCAIDNCALCEMLPARGLFYAAVLCQGKRSILELGTFSANDLEQHVKLLHGGMRPGLQLRLSRIGKKQPVRSEVMGEVAGCGVIDKLTLAQRVLALYKLPCCNPDETIEQYEMRVVQIVRHRNSHLAAQLAKSQSAGV